MNVLSKKMGGHATGLSANGGVHPRHYFSGKKFHRALGQRWVHPVVAGIQQVAKIAHFIAEGQYLIDD
jgi:hypothetical protein